MKVIEKYDIFIGSVITVLTALFGQFWYFFAGFLVLNFVDFFSGWYKARVTKTENSQKGLKGIAKKVWLWVIIGLAFMLGSILTDIGSAFLNLDLSFLALFGWFTLISLSVNEFRSIFENLVVAGINVPNFLIKGLSITQNIIDKSINIPDGDTFHD